jgi:hypothetical protein
MSYRSYGTGRPQVPDHQYLRPQGERHPAFARTAPRVGAGRKKVGIDCEYDQESAKVFSWKFYEQQFLPAKMRFIQTLIEKGQSKSAIARLLETEPTTLDKFYRRNQHLLAKK